MEICRAGSLAIYEASGIGVEIELELMKSHYTMCRVWAAAAAAAAVVR